MNIRIRVGSLNFEGRLETALAPKTCAAFVTRLPFHGRLIQARWSGEAAWMPLGEFDFGVGPENTLTHPAPGQLLLYPAAVSETEILFPYGQTAFASKFGPLAGNHFLTLTSGMEQLSALGDLVLTHGAQAIVFETG